MPPKRNSKKNAAALAAKKKKELEEKEMAEAIDFDSWWEEDKKEKEEIKAEKKAAPKEAKYMATMIQASKERQLRRDVDHIAYKVAEDMKNSEGQGDAEVYVTESYRKFKDESEKQKRMEEAMERLEERESKRGYSFSGDLMGFKAKMMKGDVGAAPKPKDSLEEMIRQKALEKKAKMDEEDDYYETLNSNMGRKNRKRKATGLDVEFEEQVAAVRKQDILREVAENRITKELDDEEQGGGNDNEDSDDELGELEGPQPEQPEGEAPKPKLTKEERAARARERWDRKHDEDSIDAFRERFHARMENQHK